MDESRNYPDLGKRFEGIMTNFKNVGKADPPPLPTPAASTQTEDYEKDVGEKRDLDWSAVFKRTFEAYIRGERPNLYGEMIEW